MIRIAIPEDVPAIDKVFRTAPDVLAYVPKVVIAAAIARRSCLVVEQDEAVIAAVLFHHRRDGQTTVRELAVRPEFKRQGWGTRLVEHIRRESGERQKAFVLAKCPVGAPSNAFWNAMGFRHVAVQEGRKRNLNVWKGVIDDEATCVSCVCSRPGVDELGVHDCGATSE